MNITRADMAKIQVLLPEGLAFDWDASAIHGLFYVIDSADHTITVGSNGDKRCIHKDGYSSVHRMPLTSRIVLPTGRGWHGVAANTIRALLAAETVA